MKETAAAPVFAFRFEHRPAPQGSYRPVAKKDRSGQYTGKVAFLASSPGLKTYRAGLAWVVQGGRRGVELDEPVGVSIRWEFPRPARPDRKSFDPAGRAWPATRSTGDGDKLTRAVFDALTLGHAIADDSLVVGHDALMTYRDDPPPGWEGSTDVRVYPINDYLMMRN